MSAETSTGGIVFAGSSFVGGVCWGFCVGIGSDFGRDLSGSDRGVVAAGADASAPGTKPGAFAEASTASIFPTLPRGDCFGLVVGYGCDLDLCGRLLERMVPASVTGFSLCGV